MSDIEWKENAVCYINGGQRNHNSIWINGLLDDEVLTDGLDDFQLNEIREGDFIPASELDTEQKYNEVVEVFGLSGFEFNGGAISEYGKLKAFDGVTCCTDGLWQTSNDRWNKRQLTYHQIIAIGKLKRMMLKRQEPALMDDNSVQAKLSNIGNVLHNLSCSENDEDVQGDLEDYAFYLWELSKSMVNEKSEPKTTTKNADQVKNPKHYQLIEGVESIEIIARSMTQEQWKGFCLGNMLKYRIRAGKKDALQQDIEKANFYGELYEMHKDKCYG